MKKVLFLHPKKASLPEIQAYLNYFQDHKKYLFFDCKEMKDFCYKDFDLIWRFMGLDMKKSTIPVLHEYASLSVGRFATIKDYIKRYCNISPLMRIFLNRNIARRYGFADKVPTLYRDMGIDKNFFVSSAEKEYDFLYLGNMNADRNIHVLLDNFLKNLKDSTFLLIGSPPNDLYNRYKSFGNLIFTGFIPYHKVPDLASKAEYAINYIPNKHPYDLQTSTKLLEYIAMDLKIITTSYQWVVDFEKEREMSFFKISEDLRELNYKSLKEFRFKNMDVYDLEWDKIICSSKIEDTLNQYI